MPLPRQADAAGEAEQGQPGEGLDFIQEFSGHLEALRVCVEGEREALAVAKEVGMGACMCA